MPTARPRPLSRQQAYRQSLDFATTSVDVTVKFDSIKLRSVKISRVWLSLPAGLAANGSNFCNFKLVKNAATVVASFSTVTGGAPGTGTIAALGAVNLLLTSTLADQYLADGDTLSLFLDVTGSPTVPLGRIVVEGTEL